MAREELDTLYRDVILDHHRLPRNTKRLLNPKLSAEGYNPVCGDKALVEIDVDDNGAIRDVCIEAQGCSISVAAGSIMGEELIGKRLNEARALVEQFRSAMRGECALKSETGDVEALEGVKNFPVRIKCALLPWATLAQAIDQQCEIVGPKVAKTE